MRGGKGGSAGGWGIKEHSFRCPDVHAPAHETGCTLCACEWGQSEYRSLRPGRQTRERTDRIVALADGCEFRNSRVLARFHHCPVAPASEGWLSGIAHHFQATQADFYFFFLDQRWRGAGGKPSTNRLLACLTLPACLLHPLPVAFLSAHKLPDGFTLTQTTPTQLARLAGAGARHQHALA